MTQNGLIGGTLPIPTSQNEADNLAEYGPIAADAAMQYNVPVNLFMAQIYQESSFNPSAQNGSATGIAQTDTAQGQRFGFDPSDPIGSLYGAAAIDSALYSQSGNWATVMNTYGTTTNSTGVQAALAQLGQTSNTSVSDNGTADTSNPYLSTDPAQVAQGNNATTASNGPIDNALSYIFGPSVTNSGANIPATVSGAVKGAVSGVTASAQDFFIRAVLGLVAIVLIGGALILFAGEQFNVGPAKGAR